MKLLWGQGKYMIEKYLSEIFSEYKKKPVRRTVNSEHTHSDIKMRGNGIFRLLPFVNHTVIQW